MFFELHGENRIGYKELSNADLGRSDRSNQTHIGLFDDVLTFLPNSDHILDAMVIFNGMAKMLALHFDRIQNPDNTFRSPKIRAGRNGESVLSYIRRTAREVDPHGNWYLFWFGLKSKQPVFLFFNKGSETYCDLQSFGINLRASVKGCLTPDHVGFESLINYLERIVNVSGTAYAEELELMVQLGKKKAPTIRRYNFMKAQERSVKVGREGEALMDRFFEYQKSVGAISRYEWKNQEGESGAPYDFFVETLDGRCIYLDVKTTDYRFEQKMIFSNQEIAFATEYNEDYFVYRVYCNANGERCLRICADESGLFEEINERTNEYKLDLEEVASVQSVKFEISPCNEAFSVTEPIVLSK